MFRKLLPYVGKYKKYALLAPLTIIIEVFLEVNIPRVMAKLVDVGIANRDFSYILKMGLLMILMAVLSLVLGVFAARFASITCMASQKGCAGLFHKIQDFSFANMDKFTTASLVTRLTTDVNNANDLHDDDSYDDTSPIMLIMAVFMAVLLNAKLSLIFCSPYRFWVFLFTSLHRMPFPFSSHAEKV